MTDWQPGASLEQLRLRAAMYENIRAFFAGRDVLEVDTHQLGRHGVSDCHIESIAAADYGYLQSSPEYAMKRLLCAGSGDIYQLGKAFRAGEQGRLHNPEFTLLEWYRCGFDTLALIAEINALVADLSTLTDSVVKPVTLPYASVFNEHTGCNPHTASEAELRALVAGRIANAPAVDGRSELLDLMFTHCVQDKLQALSFVYNYPACQAALARLDIDADGHTVALRFECFYHGVELANGYDELRDAAECVARFERDNRLRKAAGLAHMPIDERFIAALQSGLPACSGVALGVDRLLLVLSGASSLDEVLAFSASRN